jgi:hypothetical protein
MGLSVRVSFHRKPTDPTWDINMKAATALYKAGIYELPKKLADYFGTTCNEPADLKSALEVKPDVNLDFAPIPPPSGTSIEHGGDASTTLVIDLDAIHRDVRVIKVTYG